MAEGDATVYNHAKEIFLLADVNLATDTLKVMLMQSGYTFSADGSVGRASVDSLEITSTGYTAGGKVLSSAAVTQRDSVDNVKFDGTDITWTALGTDVIRSAILWDDTPTATTSPVADPLLVRWEIATNSNGGNYTLQFGASGILVLS